MALNSRSAQRLTEVNDDEAFREHMSQLPFIYRHLKYFPVVDYSPDIEKHRVGDEAVWSSNQQKWAARNSGLLAANHMNKDVFNGGKNNGFGHCSCRR